MRFIRRSVKTTGIQIKPQGYITFVTRAAPLIRPLTITQLHMCNPVVVIKRFDFLAVLMKLKQLNVRCERVLAELPNSDKYINWNSYMDNLGELYSHS